VGGGGGGGWWVVGCDWVWEGGNCGWGGGSGGGVGECELHRLVGSNYTMPSASRSLVATGRQRHLFAGAVLKTRNQRVAWVLGLHKQSPARESGRNRSEKVFDKRYHIVGTGSNPGIARKGISQKTRRQDIAFVMGRAVTAVGKVYGTGQLKPETTGPESPPVRLAATRKPS